MSLKVLHVVAGSINGGAAKGAYNLHDGLIKIGVDSRMIVQNPPNLGDKNICVINSGYLGVVKRKITNFKEKAKIQTYRNHITTPFSTGMYSQGIINHAWFSWADIVNLHWINAGMISLSDIGQINKPLVWTVRDMWPFTGGCHVALNCENYKKTCGKCPQLSSEKPNDLSTTIQKQKINLLKNKNINVVGISKWVSQMFNESRIGIESFTIAKTIENCINTDIFYPGNKAVLKKELGLPSNKKIVLTGAGNMTSKFKGGVELLEAAKVIVGNKEVEIHGFGRGDEISNINYIGYIGDNDLLRKYYAAADVFLMPSIQDAFGKTVAESMACGTPVVCFDYSGPGTLIDDEITGLKANPFDSQQLGRQVMKLLSLTDKNYDTMIENCVSVAKKRFNITRAGNEYFKLYESILND